MTNIYKLNIKKFRGIKNQEILIGKHLTAIMGQNGAQKSTILGMLAQPFNFTGERNLINEPYYTQFSDIFNFSEEFDAIGDHEYSIELFSNSKLSCQLPKDNFSFNVKSRKRTGNSCLFIFDKEESEFNDNRNEFKGLIITYGNLKKVIMSEELSEKLIAKTHRENELSLKELLIYFKENRVEKIYKSTEQSSDSSKMHLIIELKATSSHLRFVTGDTNQSGDGNLTFPVIYLGLSRVVPLGEIDRDNITQLNIEKIKSFEHEISSQSKEILLDYDSPEYKATPLDIADSSYKGTRVGIHTDNYSPITMSAGQDNLGRILSSIYSFKYLQDEIGDKYIGGLLLIDELDATLYPGAQKKLIEFMKTESKKLNIQIVFTTHSIHIVDAMYSKENTDKYSINYLKRTGDILVNKQNMTPELIYYDIAVQSKNISKIPCICEDGYSTNMLKALIEESDEFSPDDFEFIDSESSYTTIKKLMAIQNKYMQHNIYVIDGDQSNVIDELNEKGIVHTGISLPIDDPEVVISHFITNEIPNDHAIFQDYEYNKQQLTSEFNIHQSKNTAELSKEFIKKQVKTGKRIFLNNCEELFNIWANWFKENKPNEFNRFIKDFYSVYNIVVNNIDKKI